MRTPPTRAACALAALVLSAACNVAAVAPNDNIGWVTTLVDSTTPALAAARTFAMPDTIVELDGDRTLDHAADHAIVAHVRAHFVALGWTEIRDATGNPPDVVVVMGASMRTEVGVSYSGWYGAYGWMPYWGAAADPAWLWGMPAGAIPYTYEVGTLLLTMVDLRAPRASTKRVPLLWVAAVNGVLGDAGNLTRAYGGIDQAFAQSPYLRVP